LLDQNGSLTFAELCARMPQVQAPMVRAAVMNLASHEVLSIG
jgi:hypothetical protein